MSYADEITLKWQASVSEDVAGYRIYMRKSGEVFQYSTPVWEGNATQCDITVISEVGTYYFVARAFSSTGVESVDSNAASYEVKDSDNDGFTDYDEINIYGTDPLVPDSPDDNGDGDIQDDADSGTQEPGDNGGDVQDDEPETQDPADNGGDVQDDEPGTQDPVDNGGDVQDDEPETQDPVDNGGESESGAEDEDDGNDNSQGISEPDPDPENPADIIVDNDSSSTQAIGSWYISDGSDPYGDDSLSSQDANSKYIFRADISGCHEVSLWWTGSDSRSDNIPVEIYDGENQIAQTRINQRVNSGKWNSVGMFDFTGNAAVVINSKYASYSTNADAVKFSILEDCDCETAPQPPEAEEDISGEEPQPPENVDDSTEDDTSSDTSSESGKEDMQPEDSEEETGDGGSSGGGGGGCFIGSVTF